MSAVTPPKPEPVLQLPKVEGTFVWGDLSPDKEDWVVYAKRGCWLVQSTIATSATLTEQAMTWATMLEQIEDYELLDVALSAAGRTGITN